MVKQTAADQIRSQILYNKEIGTFVRLSGPNKGAVVSGHDNGTGYLQISIRGKRYYAHRLAWLMEHGKWPPEGLEIDHVNRCRSDNRISNLRLVSRNENFENSSRKKSLWPSVSWDKRYCKWVVRKRIGDKQRNFGRFRCLGLAIKKMQWIGATP